MGQVNVKQVETLDELRQAAGHFYTEWLQALRTAEQALQAEERRVAECVSHWKRTCELRHAESDQARAVLSRCAVPVRDPNTGAVYYPPCTSEKAALARAEDLERAAQRELAKVREGQSMLSRAGTEYRDYYRHVARTVEERVPMGRSFLERKVANLRQVLTAGALPGLGDITPPDPGLGSVSGSYPSPGATLTSGAALSVASGLTGSTQALSNPGGGSPPAATTTPTTGGPGRHGVSPNAGLAGTVITLSNGKQLHMVSLDRIDFTSFSVQNLGNFNGLSPGDMQAMLTKWQNEVGPGVLRGASGDYYSDLDDTNGVDYQQGYRRVYDLFYGNDPIALSSGGSGGRYTVLNGEHRLFMARAMGISALPVIFG